MLGWVVFAHQGGWDEILMVAAPVALFAGLLWMANRRADAHHIDRGYDRFVEKLQALGADVERRSS